MSAEPGYLLADITASISFTLKHQMYELIFCKLSRFHGYGVAMQPIRNV